MNERDGVSYTLDRWVCLGIRPVFLVAMMVLAFGDDHIPSHGVQWRNFCVFLLFF